MIPKAIKECQKKLETESGGIKKEELLIKKIKFLKESIPFIERKDEIDALVGQQNKNKKSAGNDLPAMKAEMKKLSAEIDELKKGQGERVETTENYDKVLDRINEKRKKEREEKLKLQKSKDELRDEYFDGLLQFTKQSYLVQDINWMTDM